MIRQICPHCFGAIELPDAAAGTSVECSVCHKSFAVPGRHTPTVADAQPPTPAPAPAPMPALATATTTLPLTPGRPPVSEATSTPNLPPGLVVPAEPPKVPTASSAPGTPGYAPPVPPVGMAHTASVTLAPALLEWLPVVCFTLILVLTFFSWVGMYPGGYLAYSQSPWGAFVGNFETNPISEEVMKLEVTLKKVIGSNWTFLLPYLFGVVLATALAWADRFVTVAHVTALPGPLSFVQKMWPHRFPVLTGLAIGTLLLLLVQVRLGFGLENAIKAHVTGEYAEALAAADNSSSRQKLLVKQGMNLGQYELQGTTCLALALAAHGVAVAAAAGRFWLYRRGPKPLPRITLQS